MAGDYVKISSIRLGLGITRWWMWSFNAFYYLFVNAFVGPLGIRALCGIDAFHPDVQIDSTTGRVSPSHYQVETVISTFRIVLEGMSDSRSAFEA
jgi:hypothetical protein